MANDNDRTTMVEAAIRQYRMERNVRVIDKLLTLAVAVSGGVMGAELVFWLIRLRS